VSKNNTLVEKFRAIQKIGHTVEIPWQVNRVLGSEHKKIEVAGDQVCIQEDFVSLEEARDAVEWYVKQLGGKVEWDNGQIKK
jgi:hypothetical protein